ncbi:MAG: alpha/beta fold hydrolase [Oscillochloridaceae bacterium umkhey_bin13]
MNHLTSETIVSRFVTVGGYKLHMLEAGQGPVVLLLHGFAGSAEDWRRSLSALAARGYRAIALDLLGFGRSAKPADAPYGLELMTTLLVGLLDQLELAQVHLIAHSMGGKYALALAVNHPHRVSRLVLTATDGFVAASPMVGLGGNPVFGASILWIAARPAITRAMLGASFADPVRYVTPDVITRGREALLGPENRRALVALSRRYAASDLGQTGLRARLGELRLPILLIWGAEDRVFPADPVARTAAASLPHAHLLIIPNCGHFPQIEAERQWVGVVLGFLAAGSAIPA